MKKVLSLIIFFIAQIGLSYAQTTKIYYIGHSLVNLDMPSMVQQTAKAANKPADYRHHINIGAPLILNWSEPAKFNGNDITDPTTGITTNYGTNFLVELARGGYTALVLTEAQDFQSNFTWNDPIRFGRNFDSVARRASPNIKTYCYETWTHVVNYNYAAWRQRINQDRPTWERMARGIRTDGLIVPAGQAMAALYDALQGGSVGRLTTISQVFSDDIHLNYTGNYYVAMVMYATLFKTSPEGLPYVVAGSNLPTTVRVETDAPTRLALQRLAWQVVRNYALSGVTTPTVELSRPLFQLKAYPNPTMGQVAFERTNDKMGEIQSIEVYNLQGQRLRLYKGVSTINIASLPNGIYVFLIRKEDSEQAIRVEKM